MYLHPYNAGMMFADGFGVDPTVGLRTIYIKLCAEGRTICYKIDDTNIQNYKDYFASFAIAETDRPQVEFLDEFVDTSIYETLDMVDFYEFIANEVDPLYKIGTSYADFLEIAEDIDGIDHSSTVGKTVDKWMKENAIVTELDQSHRRCGRGTAPAAGAEGLGRGFGALVGMDAAADITAGTARASAVRTAAKRTSAKIIAPAAAAEAVLVIGAEFRFRLALPAHILRRDLI